MAKKKATGKDNSKKVSADASQKMTLAEFQKRQRAQLRSPDLSYQRAYRAMEKYRDKLMKKKNVIGVDVGMKLQGPASTREFSVWIYVKEKLSPEEAARLPVKDRIPEYLDDIPTDIHAPNFVPARSTGIPGGTEITPKGTSNPGTLGIDVFSMIDMRLLYLTCAHVVSKDGKIQSETEMVETASNKTVGKVCPEKGKGKCYDYSEYFDCALIDPGDLHQARVGIPDGITQPVRFRYAYPSDVSSEVPVWKYGAKTKKTDNGIVINHKSSAFSMQQPNGVIINLKDHVLIKPLVHGGRSTGLFADLGDSGAMVCIDDDIIGILRAVDVDTKIVAAAPIVDAAEHLNFGI